MMALSKLKAVITGDVIGSRKSGPSIWMPALKSVLDEFGNNPEDWDIYRGDAFQLLINDPCSALNITMRIKAGFKATHGLDIRMAIGIGKVDFRSQRIGESSGEAFILSGALVEELESMHTTLALSSPWPSFTEDFNASLAMAAALMDRWLPNYAQAMSAYLAQPALTQRELGDTLGLAQNTLSERLTRAYRRELVQFEQTFRRRLAEHTG